MSAPLPSSRDKVSAILARKTTTVLAFGLAIVFVATGILLLATRGAGAWSHVSLVSTAPDYGLMAYDSKTDLVLALVGSSTWSFDPRTANWMNVTVGSGPPVGLPEGFVYDSVDDRFILFGQEGGIGSAPMTWAYNASSRTWSDMGPSSEPPISTMFLPTAAMAYDSKANVAVLYYSSGNGCCVLNQTWTYSYPTNHWAYESPGTEPGYHHNYRMVYDSRADRSLVFFVSTMPPSPGDMWSYDLDNDTWSQRNPSPTAPARYNYGMGYNPNRDTTLLFGGRAEDGPLADTWEYDFNANAWSNLTPFSPPPATDLVQLIYDMSEQRMLLLGGTLTSGSYSPMFWTFDYGPPGTPQGSLARASVSAAAVGSAGIGCLSVIIRRQMHRH